MGVRIFKTPSFADWAEQHDVADATLCKAAVEVEDGLVDARLGGFIVKKRMAAPGGGKSGSNRAIIAHRQEDRLIFLYGFRKKDMENISKKERWLCRSSATFLWRSRIPKSQTPWEKELL